MSMLLSLAAGLVLQAKPNPEYEWWKGAPAGAWVKFSASAKLPGGEVSSERVLRVMSTDKDKVVVERTGTVSAGGRNEKLPPKVTQIPALDGPPLVVEKEYKENLEVKGKPVECTVIEGTHVVDGEKRPVKYWLAVGVAGRVVKSESRSEATQAVIVQVAQDWGTK